MDEDVPFDKPPPAQRHSDTSMAAARRVEPSAGSKRAIVLGFLLKCGPSGATDEEMQRGIPMAANTQRPRRVELCSGGWARDSGLRRRCRGGDAAVVWVATEFVQCPVK